MLYLYYVKVKLKIDESATLTMHKIILFTVKNMKVGSYINPYGEG